MESILQKLVYQKLNQPDKTVLALESISNVTAPAQKHATDDAVYTV